VWIVGIIVVVAVILFLLQSNVPEATAPVEETPATEEVQIEESTVSSETPTVEEPEADNASDSVRVELEGRAE